MDLFNLEGKVAIVTGCSSPVGIGYAIAEGLAEAGADIAGVARSDLDEVKEAIESKTGRKFLAIQADLMKEDNLDKIVEETLAEYGKIDILVNNAGMIRRNPILDFTVEDWDSVMKVNLRSLFLLTQKVANYFVDNNVQGKVINTASMLSYQGGKFVPSYTASKHAVAGITKSFCNELAAKGINVNAIAPGYIATNNTAPLRKDKERSSAILSRIPAGRWGQNDDLKGAAIFLAAEASDYMHGALIPVDGGWLAS
ncbi:2-deoxy-D-gluconate 3-dehydrogenase [Halanaerobium saccharolyticum subsp. saccharolyticum DSM 6643]|uniref:2-deoxy-D-gluconate 3-dehydrogenase n=1 Tax=Halanaerobium saccharolyticum subsp. saccharolyticum DSM 6643 TaxID=1293054 RepID=M5E440_9FIRM|nr:2-dehydro-3-deoxy-D-gluconate 5-dehydrogenase KduD [Halanaerobium saccharolyticum]CCU81001.1 2-deoxy-D-gluconate 3-dehydrogenase [Halanaerobium saccharolyticum subsp. saccharolyticum DSM 6643]